MRPASTLAAVYSLGRYSQANPAIITRTCLKSPQHRIKHPPRQRLDLLRIQWRDPDAKTLA